MHQIVQGLCHMKNVGRLAHHDLSLENIGLDGDDQIRILDLGMCLKVPQECTEPLDDDDDNDGDGVDDQEHHHADGTTSATTIYLTPQPSRGKPSLVAPEVVRRDPYDPFAADIWSLSICLVIMLTGHPLYGSPNDKAFQMLVEGQTRELLDAYEGFGLCLPSGAKELVCRMLNPDASKRPTLEEVLEDPWLAGPLHHSSSSSSSAAAAAAVEGMNNTAAYDSYSTTSVTAAVTTIATTTTTNSTNNTCTMRPLIRRSKLSVKGRHTARSNRTHEASEWLLHGIGWLF